MSDAGADNKLVTQAKCGDKDAFNQLVVKYQFKIMKLVGRYVHDPHEMLDVTQEVFIKVYKAIAGFRGDSAFYTWIYRIAINTAKNHVIAQDRRPPDTDIDSVEAQNFEGRSALKEQSTPERELLSKEIETAIFRVIEHLSRELRTAIILREFEGLSYDEIAAIMKCPVGTVRSRIFRAREAIDKEIKPLLNE